MQESVSPYQPPASDPLPFLAVESAPQNLSARHVLFSFEGRIPRRTFWLWSIICNLSLIVPMVLLVMLMDLEGFYPALGTILLVPLVVLYAWTSLAIRVKRWHDHNKRGLWVLFELIPYIGGIISLFVLGAQRGTEGGNRFGSDPT